jgi:CHAT domain-containing protein
MSSDVESPPPGFYDTQTKNHRILSMKWDEVVRQIRQIDGFETFLQAVPFTSLQSAAAEGPVIVVNISQYRSDAIILQQRDPPALVCLPDALPDTLHQLSTDLSSALALDDDDHAKAILPILQELWLIVVSPVVDRLAALEVVERSRIWWCPTSHLCALPLHAAGPYLPHQRNLPDIYTSSYTPTLSSLIRARSHVVPRLTSPKVLAMGQPNDHLEKSKLPLVREELRRIQNLGNSVDIMLGDQVDRETLLPLLQQYSWVHFACHGHLAAKAPFLSSFQLHDNERLTLADLIKARLPNAELAFLSACHSAAIDVNNTPDEVLHLSAALQFCGFRSVIGTLWAMADIDGPDVTEGFYGHIFRDAGNAGDFRDAAVALNHATREMRKRRVPLDRWINFVHIGA